MISFFLKCFLLPVLGEVLKNVVRDALNFLQETQYGFRPGKSALTVAQTYWINAKARNELVRIMVFDFSAAFDTLEHLLLLRKLESANIKGIPLKWFQTYLSDHSVLLNKSEISLIFSGSNNSKITYVRIVCNRFLICCCEWFIISFTIPWPNAITKYGIFNQWMP